MHAVWNMTRAAVIIAFLLFPMTANALTVDRVTVSGRAETREAAILDAQRTAVQTVAVRYIAASEFEKKRLSMTDLILPHSESYLQAFEILEERVDDDGFTEIVALAGVEVGRLVTTLRNLDFEVTLLHLGPITQCC